MRNWSYFEIGKLQNCKITESLPAHPVVEIAPGRVGRIHSAYPALENQENRADVTQLWNNITAAIKVIQGGKESSRILNLAKTNWEIWTWNLSDLRQRFQSGSRSTCARLDLHRSGGMQITFRIYALIAIQISDFFSPASWVYVRPVRSFWPNADVIDPNRAIRRRPGRVLHCRRLRDLLACLYRPDKLLFWL